MRSVVLGLAVLTASPTEARAAAPESASANQPPEAAAPTREAPAQETVPGLVAPPIEGRRVLDRVLPCGTRVLVARDDSLPVVSLVLALEMGSEDDPPELPGLHHALAYQLLMGNREAAPGAVQALVQDSGGIAFLATGPAQIRFESLAPVTLLDDLVAAEAQRLRAPSVTQSLWKETLVSAKRDASLRRTASWEAAAVAHGAPGLGHRPRVVAESLRELDIDAVADQLARRARYEHATLVVVAPLPIEDIMAKVVSAFGDLPQRTRTVPQRTSRPSATTAPQPKASGDTFVWAVPGDPGARLWADAWCEALSRQRRGSDEPKPNRVRCAFDDDPRRPMLTVRVRTPGDPRGLLQSRLARLGDESRLLRGPLRRLERDLTTETATPLGLARRLAASPAASAAGDSTVEALTGLDALSATPPASESLFDLGAAVRLVDPESTQSPPAEAPEATTPPEPATDPLPEGRR